MEKVSVNIKSPICSIPDLRLNCDVNWTVLRLKESIRDQFPGKPSTQSQKLVYAGKLLDNSAHLQEFLRFEDECAVFTIHLVCKLPASVLSAAAGSLNSQSQPEMRIEPTNASQGDPATLGGAGQPPNEAIGHGLTSHGYAHLTNRWPGIDAGAPESNHLFGIDPSSWENEQMSRENLEQMMWMQQLYDHYVQQYLINVEGLVETNSTLYHQLIQSPGEAVDLGAVEHDLHDQQHAHPGENGGGQARNPVVLNAAGGPNLQEEEEEGERDMLSMVYKVSRVMLFLSILYYYSTFARLVLVSSLFFLFYVAQMGLNNAEERDRNNPQREDNRQPTEEGEERPPGGEEPEFVQDPMPEEDENMMTIILNCVATFFTSLLPQGPHQQPV